MGGLIRYAGIPIKRHVHTSTDPFKGRFGEAAGGRLRGLPNLTCKQRRVRLPMKLLSIRLHAPQPPLFFYLLFSLQAEHHLPRHG